jgi:hypothetical protein
MYIKMDPATASFLGVSLVTILLIFLAILISSLPLYLAVIILGGRASILKVFLTNLLVAFVAVAGVEMFGFGALAIVLISVIIYMVMFRLGVIRAAFAWVLQYIVAALLLYLAVLLGITMPVALTF